MGRNLWTGFYGAFYQFLSNFCALNITNMLY